MLDKTYKILVVVLLASILGVQVFGMINKPSPSAKCRTAIAEAKDLSELHARQLKDSLTSYDEQVYTQAKNINQQILLANEHTFLNITTDGMVQNAMLKIQIYCR